MVVASLVAALVLLAPAQGTPASRPAPTRPDLSWPAADALAGKLAQIEAQAARPAKKPKARTVEVTEPELNSYLNLTLGPKMPPELSDVAFRIEPSRLVGTGLLDLDRLKSKMQAPASPFNPLSLLGGRVAVDLKTALPTGNGVGAFQVQELTLGGVSLPVSLVQQIVQSSTRTRENPAGFDLQAPFRLPFAVKQVRLGAGKAWLDY